MRPGGLRRAKRHVRGGQRPFLRAVGEACALLLAGLCTIVLVHLLSRTNPVRIDYVAQAAVLSAAAGCCWWGATHAFWWWILPMRRLQARARRASRGSMPISSLERIGGGVGPLVPLIRDLLHQLRQEHARIGQLERELSLRVANRTDALQRRIGSLRQQATTDPLTGLHNRRALEEALPHGIDGCHRAGRPLCVLMMDVDHFKLLNDTLGHPAGDDFLRGIGQLIRSCLRSQDLAFRAGGDEFVLLLPDTTAAGAEAISARLRGLVCELARPMKLPVTPALSIGIAELREDDDLGTLLRRADQSLYSVKARRHSA